MPVEEVPPPLKPEKFTDTDLDGLVTPVEALPTIQTAELKDVQEKAIRQAVSASFKLIIAHVNVDFVNRTRQALVDYNASRMPCPENDALWAKLKNDIQHIFQTAFSALPPNTRHDFKVKLGTAAVQTSAMNFADEVTAISGGGPISSVSVDFNVGEFNGSLCIQILYGSLSKDCGKLIHPTSPKDIIDVCLNKSSDYKMYTIDIRSPGEIEPGEWDIVDN